MSEEKKYGLWEYMSEQHGLTLLESEINDILHIARQEIELPDEQEITDAEVELLDVGGTDWTKDTPIIWREGVKWALGKVRNPYPKQINP
jgi:hypothetical protein